MHTTANHPWLTADHGWLPASFMRVGEPVQTVDGASATVIAIRVVPGAAPMWDLTVSTLHDFAVGAGEFVVHNACGDSAKVNFGDESQIQHEWSHAKDFGVTENYSRTRTSQMFKDAMMKHLEDPDTQEISGWYKRSREPATHFFNPKTGLNVFAHSDGRFWGAWRLGAGQVGSLLASRGFW